MQNTLLYIYEVYRERSFSRAAKNLFISQPALSACIKKVEQEIGMQLFDRSSLPIGLTEAGELYIHAIQKIMAAENELSTQISELSNLDRGHLVIGGANFFSAYMLPPIIRAFSDLYPGVDLEITESDTNLRYTDSVQAGIDLILDGGTCDTQMFDRAVLFNECVIFAVPRDNPLNKQFSDCALTYEDIVRQKHRTSKARAVDIRAFEGEKLVLLKRGHDMHMRSASICDHAGFTPRNVVYVNQLSTAANMAAQGLGCCFVTDTLVRMTPMDRQALVYYVVADPIAWREVFIAWHRKGVKTKVMEQFVSIAQQVYDPKHWAVQQENA